MYLKIWMFILLVFVILMVILGQTTRTYDLRVTRYQNRDPEYAIVPSPGNGHLALPMLSLASVEMMILLVFFAIESASDLIAFCNGVFLASLAILSLATFLAWMALWVSAVFSEIQHDSHVTKLIETEKGEEVVAKMQQNYSCGLVGFLQADLETEAPVTQCFTIPRYYLR